MFQLSLCQREPFAFSPRLGAFGPILAGALLATFLGAPALAQPAPDIPPGVQVLAPHEAVSPKAAAAVLEKRTDVANAKLPEYPQAQRETKAAGALPRGAGKPSTSTPPASPAKPK